MTIRVFVGVAPNNLDIESQAVLEHGLRSQTDRNIVIEWMKLTNDPDCPFSGWNTSRWSTPFSGFRWIVPMLCGYEGKAIYMDSDMIPMDDIGALFDLDIMPGKCVVAKGGGESWRYCVSLWDCAAARKHVEAVYRNRNIAEIHMNTTRYFRLNQQLVQPFPAGQNWNCIDGEDLPQPIWEQPSCRMLHYSCESTQPQLEYAVPRLELAGQKHWFDGERRQHWRRDIQQLFDARLFEARQAGFTNDKYLQNEFFDLRIAKHTSYVGHRWTR